MSQSINFGADRFAANVRAEEDTEKLFANLQVAFDPDRESIPGLRRRRRRASNSPGNPIKTVSLIEEDGVLYWRDGVPERALQPPGRRGRRRGEPPAPDGSLVLAKQFPLLAPNKVIAAIGAIDQRLNPSIERSLRSRLRQLRQDGNGGYALTDIEVAGPFAGRTLLFVHGTFSNAANMLAEFKSTSFGRGFLDSAMKKYDRLVFFEHATLSVSPVINALELGRAFAGSTGQIHTIAHSRGGLIVRWWLEAFGSSLQLGGRSPVRVVFAGSPLHGTSLAAPDKLQSAMSLISNIGTFAEIHSEDRRCHKPVSVGRRQACRGYRIGDRRAREDAAGRCIGGADPGTCRSISRQQQPRTQSSSAWAVRCKSAVLRRQIEL